MVAAVAAVVGVLNLHQVEVFLPVWRAKVAHGEMIMVRYADDAKLKDLQGQLRRRMHGWVRGTVTWLQQVVRGYFNYHAIPGNLARLGAFRREVLRIWYRTLWRRSQRSRLTWERFNGGWRSCFHPSGFCTPT